MYVYTLIYVCIYSLPRWLSASHALFLACVRALRLSLSFSFFEFVSNILICIISGASERTFPGILSDNFNVVFSQRRGIFNTDDFASRLSSTPSLSTPCDIIWETQLHENEKMHIDRFFQLLAAQILCMCVKRKASFQSWGGGERSVKGYTWREIESKSARAQMQGRNKRGEKKSTCKPKQGSEISARKKG